MNNSAKKFTPHSHSESELITDSARIALLLKQMSKHYSPLAIRIKGHKAQFSSCIVDVEKPYVLFDELLPSSGNEALIADRKIIATGKLDGVDIHFNSTLKRVVKKKNLVTYYMSLPTEMEYQQRRMAYRVRIPMSKVLHVIIDGGPRKVIVGELHDLSHGGAGKIIPEGNTIIKMGSYYECAIELPCGEWLYCTLEMRYQKDIHSRKKKLIGAKFVNLTTVQSRLISRCISALELEHIRKRASY